MQESLKQASTQQAKRDNIKFCVLSNYTRCVSWFSKQVVPEIQVFAVVCAQLLASLEKGHMVFWTVAFCHICVLLWMCVPV